MSGSLHIPSVRLIGIAFAAPALRVIAQADGRAKVAVSQPPRRWSGGRR